MKYIRGCEVKQIDIADDFYLAYQRCLKSENGTIAAIPGFVNGLFAFEIYLKILIGNSEKITGPNGHDLNYLCSKLDIKYKEELKTIKLAKNYGFEYLVNQIRNGFQIWRYIFESGNEDFCFGHPFEYTEVFLVNYLPVIKKLATEYVKTNNKD